MMNASMAQHRSGSRLAYVVVRLDGEVERERYQMIEKVIGKHKDGTKRVMHEMKRIKVMEPAGFMVYFPRGHAIRLRTKDDLEGYGIDPKNVPICNLRGLSDPKSAVGKMLTAQDEGTRQAAWTSMEDQVIRLATAKTGPILMPEQMQQHREQAEAV